MEAVVLRVGHAMPIFCGPMPFSLIALDDMAFLGRGVALLPLDLRPLDRKRPSRNVVRSFDHSIIRLPLAPIG